MKSNHIQMITSVSNWFSKDCIVIGQEKKNFFSKQTWGEKTCVIKSLTILSKGLHQQPNPLD